MQWTQAEIKAVYQHLGTFIRIGKVPGKRHCDIAKKDSRLINREWKNIKYYVKNVIDTQKRKKSSKED